MRQGIIAASLLASCVLIGSAAFTLHAAGPTSEQLSQDIAEIDIALAEAKTDAARYAEGSILRTQAEIRIETLKTTRAMLSQKLKSWLRGIDLTYTVDGKPIEAPSAEDIAAIKREIADADAKARLAQQKSASYTGGILKLTAELEALTSSAAAAIAGQRLAMMRLGFSFPKGQQTSITAPPSPPPPPAPISADKAPSTVVPAGGEPKAPPVPEPPAWDVSESKSPLDDSAQVTAVLDSEDGKAHFIIRCKERSKDAFVALDSYVGSDKIKVVYRIDDNKAVETDWNSSTTGRAVFIPNPSTFTERLPQNGKLFIRITSYGGRRADAIFSLGDIAAVRDKVNATCRGK